MAKLDQTWTVEAHHAGSALAAELHRAMGLSHRQAKGLIDARCVAVNGETAIKHGQRLEAGDKVKVAYDPALKYEPVHAPKGALDNTFKTLWEDPHLLFVDKPAGLLTVPAEQGGEASLADAVADHYRRRGQKHAQLYIVHRLDRFTSGVLVFARTPEALHHLKKLFALHKLQRTYRAILVGELPENQGTLKGHLIEQAKTLKMRVVDPKRREAEGAQSAVTHYRVVERLPGHTVVEVELETGRRNQIRVQFADRGFPLLGDQVYGEESPLLDRQALHAETLGIRHPVTDQLITVTAPPPADFEAALKTLRARTRLTRAAAGEKGETAAAAPPKPSPKPGFKPKPEFKKPGRAPKDGQRPRSEGRRMEGREEGRPRPKRFEEREERLRASKPARGSAGGPPRGAASKPSGKPAKRFEDRPREGASHPKRFEDRPERPRDDRPRGERPRKEGPRSRPRNDRPRSERPREDRPREARPKRAFDKGPRAGAPPRDRAERSGKPFHAGAKPKPAGKPSGPRKPFPKKRG
jgi:23S rRNA pseudouridine1911/1915/1917 synthase